ncbi:MAG: dihydroorotate dehydrogenase catalytic subunit [Actinomycetota bacterium]|jgi:dihydroorotate dehydrogenase (NAD+) catalytic subunit|nr:dihydroorotate dehydrogenase catalytic subunit [Actinomycetota bacterium]
MASPPNDVSPLTTRLGRVDLATPVLLASGTFGAGREGSAYIDLGAIGGIIVKSMTAAPWKGKPTPRMCETPSGMLNAIGIQNKGVDHFITDDLPWLLKRRATVFASIAGNTVEEFVRVADKLRTGAGGIAGVEINISCPNLEDRNNMFAHSEEATAAVVSSVKKALPRKPLFPKLSPNVTSLTSIAAAALDAGADGLSLINTVFGMAIDTDTRRPRLAGTVGGLSGPAIRPIAVRAVHEVHAAWPHVPIIGQGGITSGRDALELILAGASAVAVGTANFLNPRAGVEIADEIGRYMTKHDVGDIAELVGAVKLEG